MLYSPRVLTTLSGMYLANGGLRWTVQPWQMLATSHSTFYSNALDFESIFISYNWDYMLFCTCNFLWVVVCIVMCAFIYPISVGTGVGDAVQCRKGWLNVYWQCKIFLYQNTLKIYEYFKIIFIIYFKMKNNVNNK